MRRPILGLQLPDPSESVVGDVFVNLATSEIKVFDNGVWNDFPEQPGGGGSSDIPEPTIADAGKVLGVNDQGKYALVEGGGSSGLDSANLVNFSFLNNTPSQDDTPNITTERTTGLGFFDECPDIDGVMIGFIDDAEFNKTITKYLSASPMGNINAIAYPTYILTNDFDFVGTPQNTGYYITSDIEGVTVYGFSDTNHTYMIFPYSVASHFGYYKPR